MVILGIVTLGIVIVGILIQPNGDVLAAGFSSSVGVMSLAVAVPAVWANAT
jgi:hypothetical protein